MAGVNGGDSGLCAISMHVATAQSLLDRYFADLPGYQGTSLEELEFKRVLFGGFPCYSSGPLQPHFDRIIQVHPQLPLSGQNGSSVLDVVALFTAMLYNNALNRSRFWGIGSCL